MRGGCGAAVCLDDPPLTTLVPSSQASGSPEVCLSLSARGFLAHSPRLAREPPARQTLWLSTQCALALGRRCTIAFLMVTHTEICFQKYYFSYPHPLGLCSNYYFLELHLLRLYCAPHTTYVADMFVCGADFRLPCKWRPGFAIRTNDNCVSGEIIAMSLDRGFLT